MVGFIWRRTWMCDYRYSSLRQPSSCRLKSQWNRNVVMSILLGEEYLLFFIIFWRIHALFGLLVTSKNIQDRSHYDTLVTSALGFKAKVDLPLACFLAWALFLRRIFLNWEYCENVWIGLEGRKISLETIVGRTFSPWKMIHKMKLTTSIPLYSAGYNEKECRWGEVRLCPMGIWFPAGRRLSAIYLTLVTLQWVSKSRTSCCCPRTLL